MRGFGAHTAAYGAGLDVDPDGLAVPAVAPVAVFGPPVSDSPLFGPRVPELGEGDGPSLVTVPIGLAEEVAEEDGCSGMTGFASSALLHPAALIAAPAAIEKCKLNFMIQGLRCDLAVVIGSFEAL